MSLRNDCREYLTVKLNLTKGFDSEMNEYLSIW